MPISKGDLLGPYEILSPIGSGGMGEVWKARDTRLDRFVAIKVSREQFSERFEREARAVAALNHPHICTLHDVGPNYLVMEYIEGEPLQGPLPLTQALKYGVQICDALDAAHKKGITHRDLKPGNILVTKSGIKLLDFGLAKLAHRQEAPGDATQVALTKGNAILGTLQYMAPEQLEGRNADARSDIFAFGAVLYEMLTGRRAFEGNSQASVIAAILGNNPPSLASAGTGTHPFLEHIISRCLVKDPDGRWQSASDLKGEIEWIGVNGSAAPVAVQPARRRWREPGGWILAILLLGVLSFLVLTNRRTPSAGGDVVRFSIFPPEKGTFSGNSSATVDAHQFAVSPDGRAIVFAAAAFGAKPMLWIRPIGEVSARPMAGTEGANNPFWSADSRWVGFFADGKIKKVPMAGGAVQVVHAAGIADPRGGTWGPDGSILFGAGLGPIRRISPNGESMTVVTQLDTSRMEASHRWPQFLPDGLHFLYTTSGSGIFAASLDGKTKTLLVRSYGTAVYLSPGYLLFPNGGTLVGQPFNTKSLSLTGQPVTVSEDVGFSTMGYGAFSASASGVLAYAGPLSRQGRLIWFDRRGRPLDSLGPEGDYPAFRLSPDEKRLAASLVDPKTGIPDIWVTDLARGTTSRFTFGQQVNWVPVTSDPTWSPDGSRIIFRANYRGFAELHQRSAGGGGVIEPVLSGEMERKAGIETVYIVPSDWSPDGQRVVFSLGTIESGFDLWTLPVGSGGKPERLLRSPSNQMHGNFSPDGRLIAYSSNESGKYQVYVQTYPPTDRTWQVSTTGGSEPRWRRDGREIYYLSEEQKLMAVAVAAGPSFAIPQPLFQTRAPADVNAYRTHYVPSVDGQRFLINTRSGEPASPPITVVLNWASTLKQ